MVFLFTVILLFLVIFFQTFHLFLATFGLLSKTTSTKLYLFSFFFLDTPTNARSPLHSNLSSSKARQSKSKLLPWISKVATSLLLLPWIQAQKVDVAAKRDGLLELVRYCWRNSKAACSPHT